MEKDSSKHYVDVIILSYAKTKKLRETTQKCLDSLFLDDTVNYNIVVIESNPKVSWSPDCLTIHPDFEFNYNAYLNLGIKITKSPFLALCNNDLVFEKGWAKEIIQVMEDHPEILSASPYCPEVKSKCCAIRDKIYFGYDIRKEVMGWCIFQQRKIYDFIGELNTEVDFWYSDNIYADELKLRGIKHALICNSVVHHHENVLGVTAKTVLDKEEKEAFTTKQYFKYRDALLRLKKKIKEERDEFINF